MQIIKDPQTQNLTPVGLTKKNEIAGLTPEERIGNMYIAGRSGTGKTITIENMIVSDIWNGRGGLLIDPYGDIVEDVLKHIPANKKDKTAVFEISSGDAADNIKKFQKEIHLTEMKKDDQKFLLCKLRYPVIGTHEASIFGAYLLKNFYEVVGKDKNLANRCLYVDEINNFLNIEIAEYIKKSKEYQLAAVFSDQRPEGMGEQMHEKIFPTIKHLLCFTVNQLSAITLADNFPLELSVDDITTIEKYHFYMLLSKNNSFQTEQLMKGIFPLSYPKNE